MRKYTLTVECTSTEQLFLWVAARIGLQEMKNGN